MCIRNMTNNTELQHGAHVALEQLKEHYKHCIKLSTANKINPKNAFDLQLIDYMQDIAINNPDGQMNFKIASSALDVGAKIYSNRVDCIQGVAQKVASSLMMAVDGQKNNQNESGGDLNETQFDSNTSNNSDGLNNENGEEEATRTRNKKSKTKRRQVKYTPDDAALSADIEAVILSEPVSADIQDNDMTSSAALIVHNQLVDEMSRPVFDLDYKETATSRQITDIQNISPIAVIWKNVCSTAIIEKADELVCTKFNGFLFVDKSSKMQGYDTNSDESTDSNDPFDNSCPAAPIQENEGCDFDAHNYDDGVAHDDPDDYNDVDDCQADLNKTLETVAEIKRSEYDHRLLNTWAGPHAWTTVRIPQTVKKDGAPKSVRKRIKLEQLPTDVGEEGPLENDDIAEKEIRHSSTVIRKWPKKLFKPEDHNLTEELMMKEIEHAVLRPEDTYHCMKTAAEALKLIDNDHDYTNRSSLSEEIPQSPVNFGGFDDVHDDSDDEFRADPITNGNDLNANFSAALNASFTQGDLEFAGQHLIEQPHTVAQVVIPYSRAAKKIDVRKLKYVMWNVLLPPEMRDGNLQNGTLIENGHSEIDESTKKTPSPTPSESAVHLAFSNLYGELPVRVNHRMANDLSQPIAFVTLLHLANEKNLKLIPKQDLKDFIIEQDEVVVE